MAGNFTNTERQHERLSQKIILPLMSALMAINIGWLGWLSLQSIQLDKISLVNAKNIDAIVSVQERTFTALDKLSDRQRALELELARYNKNGANQ